MKPEQFIREFGVENAREVVEGAIYPIFGYDPVGMNYIHKQCDAAPFRYIPNCNSWSEDYAIETILIEDLKRLVESLETIESWEGIESCKEILHRATSKQEPPEKSFARKLQMDVANYESIYGGGDE